MKLALAQIDMRLGDIEGICGRIEDQARLAHERGARVLCVPAPLFMGAMPGGLVGAADFEHDMLAGLTGVAERIQELDMICIVPAAVSFEGQPLLDYMMLKDGHVVPARSSIALQRGENNDTRWAPPVFDVDGVRIAVIFDLDRELEMLPTGVDLIAYFQFNAFDMTDRETAAIAAVRSGAYRKIASKRSVWFACMAPVGAYDESVYTGGSFVLDDCGRVVAQAPCFEESLLVQEIQRGVMLDALEDHELPEFRSEEWLWQALVLAVRDNARAHDASRAVVALEGDLPSSLLAWCWGATVSLRRRRKRPRLPAVPPSAPSPSVCTFAPSSAMHRMRRVCSIATCRRAMPSVCARARWASCWRTRRSSWVRWR